jgi:hypothetical protein
VITKEERARLRELLSGASPTPWKACGHARGGCTCGLVWAETPDYVVAQCRRSDPDIPSAPLETMKVNAALISAAISALPSLLNALDDAEREIAALDRRLEDFT